MYVEKAHSTVEITIHPSDGDIKPGGPLGAFREEQAMSQHRVSPSPFLSSSSTPFFFLIRGTTALKSQDRLKQLLPDGSTGGLVVSKVLSLNLNFSFLNRISLLLISSSYSIGLTRLGGPRSRPYTSRKISRV